ncbi:peptidase S41 [Flavobacterium sufflavum]|uniref:Peptidase S41 n=1 Tax=Flavobacterium sufflavum TaxID=1921138 RepID=A0A437KVP0_9FLAO|nr:S41 family peptidase [Flavobacterium sufflavum]RVT76464.1 peptidase S41 [Flavobacterium sufflavum]
MIHHPIFEKRILLFLFIVFFFAQCSTVKKDNAHLQQLIGVNQLKEDIDFTHKKFQKLHPKLDYYISKESLDYQFDSLKTTIDKPLTPLEFYKKISIVVASIRQGHSYVLTPEKQFSKKETKALIKKGVGPFSQFDFSFYNDKLYVIKNKSYNKTIQPGTEVLSVNGIQPQKLIREYNRFYSSDGFNTTLKDRIAAKRFVSAFTTQYGIKDSLQYVFKSNDSIENITIKRFKLDSIDKKEKKKIKKTVPVDKAKQQALKRKKRINGYDKSSNNFIRNLDFFPKDSSVAILKIRGFKSGNFRKFYKESFAEIRKRNTKTLIIDLRNNGGGRLNEIIKLYSYLADSTFVFLKKSEVVSRASLFNGVYFNKGSVPVKAVKALFSPLIYSYLLLNVHKDKDGKNYFDTDTQPQQINKRAFKGKIYVLINGASFSASSIISSNLKGSKRATFVGEETGGDYNGTVAGFMPVVCMPHSKLKVRIGIMNIAPYYQTKAFGHGVFPDIPITPSLEDQIQGEDPELDWITNQNQ